LSLLRDGAGPLPDSNAERLVLVSVAVLMLGTGMSWAVNDPGVWFGVQSGLNVFGGALSAVSGSGGGGPHDTLYLSASDAERLNNDYADLNTAEGDRVGEQGYCLAVGSGGRISKVQQAGTVKADEDSVTFTLANCQPIIEVDGTAHFHPSGSLKLSEQDRMTLRNSPYTYSCVQGGLVSTAPGTGAGEMKCYRFDDSGDLVDVSVRIAG